MRPNPIRGVLAVLLLGACALSAAAQATSLSRTMQQAINLYEKGKDQEALDRFIDVLSRGDPEEKSLASDYITKINLRMSSSQSSASPQPPPAATPPAKATAMPAAAPTPAATLPAPAPRAPAPALKAMPAAALPPPAAVPPPAPPMRSEAAMRKEISTRLETQRKAILERLKKENGVQVSQEDEGRLDSIAIPSDLLFDRDTAFRIPQAEGVLSSLAGLAFTNGDAVMLIWPEKFQAGEPSLIDMRRAMALRNFLLSEGVSPARVSTNLIGSVGNPPKKLYGFSGPIVQFRYGEALKLTRQSTGLAVEGGPALSLGASPERFTPSAEQGSLVEFSVLEGENGVSSWRFVILPAANPEKGAPIQEITGEGPVFHQVYWNGHLNYFGEQMPYGRYPVLLTAQDLKGGKSTQRLLLVLEPPKPPPVVAKLAEPLPEEAAAAPSKAKAKGKGKALRGAAGAAASGAASGVRAKGKAGKTGLKAAKAAAALAAKGKGKGKKGKGRKKGKSVPVATAQPAASDTGSFTSGSANQIGFERGSTKLTPNGENDLAKAADAIKFYQYAKKIITGYASKTEDNAAVLAEKRAEVVRDVLAQKHGVDASTMRVESKVVEEDAAKVEIGLEQGGN